MPGGDPIVPVSFEVMDFRPGGAKLRETRDHRAVMRLFQLRRADPQIEQIPHQDDASGFASEALEKREKGAQRRIVPIEMDVSDEDEIASGAQGTSPEMR